MNNLLLSLVLAEILVFVVPGVTWTWVLTQEVPLSLAERAILVPIVSTTLFICSEFILNAVGIRYTAFGVVSTCLAISAAGFLTGLVIAGKRKKSH